MCHLTYNPKTDEWRRDIVSDATSGVYHKDCIDKYLDLMDIVDDDYKHDLKENLETKLKEVRINAKEE